jgi:hypothetical protein
MGPRHIMSMKWGLVLRAMGDAFNKIPLEKMVVRRDPAKEREELRQILLGAPAKAVVHPHENPQAPDYEVHRARRELEPPPGGVLTRPGVDAERMAWQDALIRGELWLLEGHLKENCIGCGGDVECCFKHSLNIMDAATETRSMTTEPLYTEAVELARRVQEVVHPEDVKAGRHRDRYPGLAIEVSQIRTRFDAQVMSQGRPAITLDGAKKMAAEEAALEVERRWVSAETRGA